MKQLLFITLLGCIAIKTYSQSLYSQSHNEVEYQFGTIDDNDINKLSEIEKIKYEFKQIERKVTQSINEQYAMNMEISILSNTNDQPWMKLAKKFKYTPSNVVLFDENDKVMKTIIYSDDELKSNKAISEDIRQNGYHPGMVTFPKYSEELAKGLLTQGIQVEKNTTESTFKINYEEGSKEIYNEEKLTITKEWKDKDGYKNIETRGYELYQPNKGYLLKMRKFEKFIHSVNGPCITEVQIVLYKDYVINDPLKLIDKATNTLQAINTSPNPNNGIFSVTVQLGNESTILKTRITNLLTGESFDVNESYKETFTVDMTQRPAGHYAIQVITSSGNLTSHFIKQ